MERGAKAKLAGVLQLALRIAAAREKSQPTEFSVNARLSKDDYGAWRIAYAYDREGPQWRLDGGADGR